MSFSGSARFQILGKLGEGGMGVVYEAFDRERQLRVALKSLRSVDAMGLYCFKREFRALTDLSHPHIVHVHELIEEDGAWFLTMEVVEGVDFLQHVRSVATAQPAQAPDTRDASLAEAPTSDIAVSLASTPVTAQAGEQDTTQPKSVPPPAVQPASAPAVAPSPPSRGLPRCTAFVDLDRLRDALRQLAVALHALHQCGLVHRDLKPSNIRVTPQRRVMLMDFGIVAELRAPRLVHSIGQVMGTPAFMAPEQACGSIPTAAADWYAVGVMLYLALTGRLPFGGSETEILHAKQQHAALPPSVYVTGVPEDLEALCMDLLRREAPSRPRGPEILQRLGSDPTLALLPLGRPSGLPFVGRGEEISELQRALDATRAGESVCVVVEGPSGIGKTSLVDHFVNALPAHSLAAVRAAADPALSAPLVLAGRCHQRELLAFKAFDGVIDALSLYLVGLSREQRRSVLPEDISLVARLFPVLKRLSECDRPQTLDSEPRLQRTRAFAALRRLLCLIAAQRPVILRIEDLQWADAASIDLLTELLRQQPVARLMVLATWQTDAIPGAAANDWLRRDLSPHIRCHHVNLGPLSKPEQQLLVNQLHGPHAHLDHPMWHESAGHPMLLAELVRYVEESPESSVPPDMLRLEIVLARRISLLPEPARCLLAVASLASEALPLAVLGTAAELRPQDRDRAASTLVAGHLIREVRRETGERWVDPSHEQVRQAMLAQLSLAQQRERSFRLAESLQVWGGAASGTLAQQWLAAGEPVRSAHFLIAAANQASDQLALDHAAALCLQALQQLDTEPLKQDRHAQIERCQAWLMLAKVRRLGNAADPQIWDYLDQAQALATEVGQVETLATIHYLRGSLLFPRGDVVGCLAQHARARDYARQAGSPQAEARALSGLGDAYLLQGRLQSAYEHYDACIRLCRSHALSDVEAVNLPMRGLIRYFRNEPSAGLDDCMCAMRLAVRIGSHRSELIACSGAMAWILLDQGLLQDAQTQIDNALRLSRRLDNKRFEAHALVNQARLDALRGQPDLARARAEQALLLCQGQGAALTAPLALGLLALLGRSEAERSLALQRGAQLLRDGMRNPACLLFLRDALDACLGHGDLDAAETFALQLEQYTRDEPMPWSSALLRRARSHSARRLPS